MNQYGNRSVMQLNQWLQGEDISKDEDLDVALDSNISNLNSKEEERFVYYDLVLKMSITLFVSSEIKIDWGSLDVPLETG